MRNLDYGDRDSVGVFQQRPSQGWGTRAQLMDVEYAATRFYRQAMVLDVSWASTPGLLAQAVQRSAFPDRYDETLPQARALLAQISGSTALQVVGGTADPGIRNELGPVQPVTHRGAQAIRAWGFDGVIGGTGARPTNPNSDHPGGLALDLMIAGSSKTELDALNRWLIINRSRLGVAYTIWWSRAYSNSSGWESGAHYPRFGGHYDHIHVSFVDESRKLHLMHGSCVRCKRRSPDLGWCVGPDASGLQASDQVFHRVSYV